MFGLTGATKSSFINSVATLLDPSFTDLKNPARAGGSQEHVTTSIGRYQFHNFRFYDVWGLTKNNYLGQELEYIMRGNLPVNWDMTRVNNIPEDILKRGKENAHEREIHCVLFFLPQAALNDPALSHVRTLLKRNYELISSIGNMNPLLILTKVDELSQRIRQDPTATHNEIEQLKKSASSTLNIPENRIYHTVNYTSETRKNFRIDKITAIVLDAALQSASTFVEYKKESGYVW
jgi:hypothetical protein